MNKLLSSLMIVIALCVTSVSSMAVTVLEVSLGQADIGVTNQASVKAKGVKLTAGWLSTSGLGFELGYAVHKDTTGRSSAPYLDGVIDSNTKRKFEVTTLDVVKEFSLTEPFNIIAKIGISEVSVNSNYREIYNGEPDISEQVKLTNYYDYSNAAAHIYIGLAYRSGHSSITLGADLYKNGDINVLVPGAGVRLQF
jgi:hypothetical protein